MAKSKKSKETEPKAKLATRITNVEKYFAKHAASPQSDPKRRQALKLLKRAQRRLGKILKNEKSAEAAKKKL